MARFWSAEMMEKFVRVVGIQCPRSMLTALTVREWDELGDWLYYQAHPKETDPRKNRPLPEFLKDERVHWPGRKAYLAKHPAPTKKGSRGHEA